MVIVWGFTAMVPVGDGPGSPSLPGDSDGQVLVRVELSARDLGTDPPPSRCHIRAYKTVQGWILLLWAPRGPSEATRAWAKAQAPSEEIDFGEVSERTLALQCEALPAGWETLFGLFDAQHLILEPDGTALTRIEGSRDEVAEFLSGMELDVSTESVRMAPDVDKRARDAILTDQQEHAIGRAAALGYFDVPRRIQLGALADRLGTSQSALSELLRRAESRLVSVYLDNQLGGLGAVVDLEEPS